MELSSAWLEWLVLGTGHELMLFASVGILLIGLDDLLFDIIWLVTLRRSRKATRHPRAMTAECEGTLAIFLPAWREDAILPATLQRMLTAWNGEDFRVYIGCYPNDAATLLAISSLVARDRRLRLVICAHDGPTTKGDNLNQMWAALGEDERKEGRRFAAIILHDAEDHVHQEELGLYRRHLGDCAMVQIPVVPIISRDSPWIGGHYGDEFAEAHGKEMAVRSRLGLPIPSAGVGCGLARNVVALMAIDRRGDPFRADSLTEDYEVGMLIARYGLRARFINVVGAMGERIVSRGSFPGNTEAAVRQKSRWITGIALAGWDQLGWAGGVRRGRTACPATSIWAARWMLWRDRRAPLAALVLLAAYAALVVGGLGVAGQAWLGWRPAPMGDTMRLMLGFNALLLMWRLGIRGHFTAGWYGWRQGMLAVPRAFVANVIAILAARRAVVQYWHMLRSGRVVWDKTDHSPVDALPDVLLQRAALP